MDRCTFVSETAELHDWNVAAEGGALMHSVFVLPILSMFPSDKLTNYNRCSDSQEYYLSLLQIDSQKYNHQKLLVI